ncbi:MAG: efflux RND transporter periplasmic adaptor subunit [Flavobacteriaceae bacterium]
MRKSLISVGFGLLLLIVGSFVSNLIININKSEPNYNNNSLTSVYIKVVKNNSNKIEIERNGKLQSSNRISIISEVQGIKKKHRNKNFKEGERFNRGETLIEINSDEFNSTVKQSRSELKNLIASVLPDIKIDYAENFNKWKNYFDNLSVEKPISKIPESASEKENLFLVGRGIESSYYKVKNLEERLSKYHIKAPFDGILVKGNISDGAFIVPNQILGEFIDPNNFEVGVNIPVNFLEKIKLNQSVSIISEGDKDDVIGKIKRINRKVDEMTQTVKIFIEFNNINLFEGKFVEIKVPLGVIPKSQLISRSLLINDEYVFVANKDDKISKAYVQPLFYNKINVIVTGLEDGTRLITSNVSGIYEGMKIKSCSKGERNY